MRSSPTQEGLDVRLGVATDAGEIADLGSANEEGQLDVRYAWREPPERR